MVFKETVHITPFDLDRTLHIYLPDDYDRSGDRYPVMYMFDGHNLFADEDATYGKSWGLADYMDRSRRKMIIVGLECNHEGNKRLEEFSPYDFHDFNGEVIPGRGGVLMEWMTGQLKPLIDRELRTRPQREWTGIGGSSMGGIMALYSIVRHNDIFSRAACLSTAVTLCYSRLKEEIRRAGDLLPDTRVYLSWGSKESGCKPGLVRYTCENLELSHMLTERGADSYPFLLRGGAHCEADWEKQNKRYMDFLWGE